MRSLWPRRTKMGRGIDRFAAALTRPVSCYGGPDCQRAGQPAVPPRPHSDGTRHGLTAGSTNREDGAEKWGLDPIAVDLHVGQAPQIVHQTSWLQKGESTCRRS